MSDMLYIGYNKLVSMQRALIEYALEIGDIQNTGLEDIDRMDSIIRYCDSIQRVTKCIKREANTKRNKYQSRLDEFVKQAQANSSDRKLEWEGKMK